MSSEQELPGVRAARAAARASHLMDKKCRIIDKSKELSIPRYAQKEIVLGELLGQGGFSNVFEISNIVLKSINQHQQSNLGIVYRHQEEEYRNFLSEHCLRDKTGDSRYAVKFLREDVMSDPKRFRTGAADLAVEFKFLASIEHPNIIKMRGVSKNGVAGFATAREGGYFIILDRLYDTLEVRIEKWKREKRKFLGAVRRRVIIRRSDAHSGKGGGGGVSGGGGGLKRRASVAHRLNVAFDIAGALCYLHTHNIVYRDLKPENIGFDVRGDVKVFDFGLAKELDPDQAMDNGTFKMSGKTGSLRYMAPEVAKCEPYNLSADVYSFGTMLWEMVSLQKPYKGFNRDMYEKLVVHGDIRPDIDDSWSFPLRSLIRRSWSSVITDRPDIHSVYKILRSEITILRGGDDSGLEHQKRRSTYVLQRKSDPALVKEKSVSALAA